MSSLRESKRMFGWRPGDILLVKERNDSFFSFPNITIQQLRSEEEINEMLQYARNHDDSPFWRGVEKALLWTLRLIDGVEE